MPQTSHSNKFHISRACFPVYATTQGICSSAGRCLYCFKLNNKNTKKNSKKNKKCTKSCLHLFFVLFLLSPPLG